MPADFRNALQDKLTPHLKGIERTGEGLSAKLESRYGEVTFRMDHDVEAESVRCGVAIPPPPGAGPEFLVFCLSTNAQYWDVKIGLDERGMLIVHADLDVDEAPMDFLAARVIARSETIIELIDDDLVPYLYERKLGSAVQLERWGKKLGG